MEYRKRGPMCSIVLTAMYLLAGVAVYAKSGGQGTEIPPPGDDEPITARLTRYEVPPAGQAEFHKALTGWVKMAIRSEGNIMAEAYQEEDKPTVLWLIHRWANTRELEKFTKSEHGKALEALLPTLSGSPETHRLIDLEPLTRKQWRAMASSKDQPLTIMLFVDARAGTQQQFKDTYHIAMPRFRGEAGVVTYQLSEIEGDGTQFVTYEKFRSKEAFQYHLNFPPVKPVVEYLESNVKQPPFQNGLHHLVEIAPLTRE